MAFDAFLKIDGIPGESTRNGMEDAIDISSYSFGVQNTTSAPTGGGGAAGRPDFTDLSFVAPQSVATVELIRAVALARRHAEATMTLRRITNGDSIDYYTITMSDVLVSSFHEAGSPSDDRPSNAFSLTFSKIQWSYSGDGHKTGAVEFAWDGAKSTS